MPLNSESSFWNISLSVYMYTLVMPEQWNRFHSCSVFNNLCVIGQCPVNMYITALKMQNSKQKNCYFLDNYVDEISLLYGDHVPK